MLPTVAAIWIADLWVSQATAEKIQRAHRIDVLDIYDEIVCVRGLRCSWHDHPDRGRRALVEVSIRSTNVLVVLYPRDGEPFPDAWNLGSAYPVNT
jgi:hypothetical protein